MTLFEQMLRAWGLSEKYLSKSWCDEDLLFQRLVIWPRSVGIAWEISQSICGKVGTHSATSPRKEVGKISGVGVLHSAQEWGGNRGQKQALRTKTHSPPFFLGKPPLPFLETNNLQTSPPPLSFPHARKDEKCFPRWEKNGRKKSLLKMQILLEALEKKKSSFLFSTVFFVSQKFLGSMSLFVMQYFVP